VANLRTTVLCADQARSQAGGENARINLWLMAARPPIDSKEMEIIVSKFEFVPLPQ
jgi:hypothetical protein